MILRYLSSTVFVFCSLVTFAQSVNPLNGQLQYSVPIGLLSAGDVSVPISITHHGRAVKVFEGMNDCGVGWGLNAGGSVTRVVRGLPDEINTSSKRGWLRINTANGNLNGTIVQGFSPVADDMLNTCVDEQADWNYLEALNQDFKNDTEPDLFYVNAPGLSLQFVFGTDGTPRLLNHQQDVNIQFPITSNPDVIVIRSNGLTYTFGGGLNRDVVERFGTTPSGSNTTHINAESHHYKATPPFCPIGCGTLYTSAWHLESMTSLNSGISATFTYTSRAEASKRHLSFDSTFYIYDRYNRYLLDEVRLKSFVAKIEWVGDIVRSVRISEELSQRFQNTIFLYRSISASNGRAGKHFLASVQQSNSNCAPSTAYEFEYVDVPAVGGSTAPGYIDWLRHWRLDYFGYANGITTNRNRPQLFFVSSQSDGLRLRVHQIAGASSVTINGDDRSPGTGSAFGALRRITPSTGGFTEIQYEPNTYRDNSVSPAVVYAGGGARVRKIISHGMELGYGKTINDQSTFRTIEKEYLYTLLGGTTSSGVLTSPVTLGYILPTVTMQSAYNIGDEPVVLYSRVIEKIPGKGQTVYENNVPGVYPETVNGEWRATKSRIARKPQPSGCLNAGQVKNGFYLFPYAPSTNLDFKRGTLARVQVLAESGSLISEQVTSYATHQVNPSTIKGIRFEKINDIYYYGVYEVLTGRVELVTQEVTREASRESPTQITETTANYAYNTRKMLESITTNSPNGTTTVQRFRYASDYAITNPAANDTMAVAIKTLNETQRGTALVEQWTTLTVPGSATTNISASITLYRDFGSNRVFPYYVKTILPGAAFTPSSVSGQSFVHDQAAYITRQTFKEYSVEGGLLTSWDDRRNTVSTHYFTQFSAPAISFQMARANECMFEGFEFITTSGLTKTGAGFQNSTGWTGERAIRFTQSGDKLLSGNVQKGANRYRVSCWVFGPVAQNVTFRAMVGGSQVTFVTLSNSSLNKWSYLEGELNITSVSGAFTIEVSTNGTVASPVDLDDIMAIPAHARASSQTFQPFAGVTSTTDDRGNSVRMTFDELGRPVNTFDRNRNLVQRNEYALANAKPPKPYVGFSTSVEDPVLNQTVTFTPNPWQCDPNLNFAWEVNGVGVSSASNGVMQHTFTTPGLNRVRLTTSSNSYGTAEPIELQYCVQYEYSGTVGYDVTNSLGEPAGLVLDCNSGARNINLTFSSSLNLPTGCELVVSWTKNGAPFATGLGITVYGYSGSPTTDIYQASISLNCLAYKECTFTFQPNYTASLSVSVVNNPNPNCQ